VGGAVVDGDEVVDEGMFRILWVGGLLVVSDACRPDPEEVANINATTR
jgi:hypothetical protein